MARCIFECIVHNILIWKTAEQTLDTSRHPHPSRGEGVRDDLHGGGLRPNTRIGLSRFFSHGG